MQTQEWEEFDYRASIEFDRGRGVYVFSWTNPEGKRKALLYETPTKVDAIVEGRVAKGTDQDAYVYSYSLTNLETSQQKLQTLNLEIRAAITQVHRPDAGWYSAPFTDYLKTVFKVSDGWHWADTKSGRTGVPPGQIQSGFSFTSGGLPSIVKCYVNGYWKPPVFADRKSEDPPMGLLDAKRSFEWKLPQGFTVGPDERLEKMSLKERLAYLIEHLPKLLELGWIENPKVMGWYETNLKAGKAAEVRAHAEADFKKSLITSEVLALMTYLTQ